MAVTSEICYLLKTDYKFSSLLMGKLLIFLEKICFCHRGDTIITLERVLVASPARTRNRIESDFRDGTDLRRWSNQQKLLFFFGGGFRLLVFSGCQDHLPPPATRPIPSTSFQTTLPDQPPDHSLSSLQTISPDPPPDHIP